MFPAERMVEDLPRYARTLAQHRRAAFHRAPARRTTPIAPPDRGRAGGGEHPRGAQSARQAGPGAARPRGARSARRWRRGSPTATGSRVAARWCGRIRGSTCCRRSSSARRRPRDQVEALRAGADDFVARLRAAGAAAPDGDHPGGARPPAAGDAPPGRAHRPAESRRADGGAGVRGGLRPAARRAAGLRGLRPRPVRRGARALRADRGRPGPAPRRQRLPLQRPRERRDRPATAARSSR